MRVDANISVGEERVEVKNIHGLRNLEKGAQVRGLPADQDARRPARRSSGRRGVTTRSAR